ncbi:hypothetical protein BD626DRAFT_618479 [Schizophyllum amplum]|uniref:3-oxoacyl-[acyl-carrier-protein] reductase n=1 Tax=Schizophyllum amplum TaxID=97359 RepID=A0A550BW01_9AGAR|nr:hypothetical protein BD626DRAFT_618479 [Auriculariopsis ampla]
MADWPRDAIVTGATQGLGKAIALRLARYGLSIGLNDIPSKKGALDEVARASRMVANAGIARPAPFLEETLESFNKFTSVSATGVFLCYQLARAQDDQIRSPLGATDKRFFHRRQATACLGIHGITVNVYTPGLVDTPLG